MIFCSFGSASLVSTVRRFFLHSSLSVLPSSCFYLDDKIMKMLLLLLVLASAVLLCEHCCALFLTLVFGSERNGMSEVR